MSKEGSARIEERGTRKEAAAGGGGSCAVEVDEGWLRNVAMERTGEVGSHVAWKACHMAWSPGHLAGGCLFLRSRAHVSR